MKLFPVAASILLLLSCNNSKKISSAPEFHKLRGTWQLNYISGSRISFDGLYPHEKPTITFAIKNKRISGNTSCNSFSGPFETDGFKISFKNPIATTKMVCTGDGESVFMQTLIKITTYELTAGYTLSLLADGAASMRFTKVR